MIKKNWEKMFGGGGNALELINRFFWQIVMKFVILIAEFSCLFESNLFVLLIVLFCLAKLFDFFYMKLDTV